MAAYFRAADKVLDRLGANVARGSISLIGLSLLVGTPVAGFAAAFFIAMWIGEIVFANGWFVFAVWFGLSLSEIGQRVPPCPPVAYTSIR